MKRIKNAQQIAPITLNTGSVRNEIHYPFDLRCVFIHLDKKKPVDKKEHQIFYQQGQVYGTIGDYCHSITHEELFELESKGMIKLS